VAQDRNPARVLRLSSVLVKRNCHLRQVKEGRRRGSWVCLRRVVAGCGPELSLRKRLRPDHALWRRPQRTRAKAHSLEIELLSAGLKSSSPLLKQGAPTNFGVERSTAFFSVLPLKSGALTFWLGVKREVFSVIYGTTKVVP
jgi:hypothetical protein